MKSRSFRAALVAVAATTSCVLVAPVHAAPGHGHAASAKAAKADKGERGGKGHGPKQDKVAKEVAKVDARLARVAKHLDRLGDEDAAAVAANVAADRAALAGAVSREDVRAFRPQVYSWVVNALAKTARLAGSAGADADATAGVESARAALLALHADASRADLRSAKDLLTAAVHAVESLEDGDADSPDDESGDDEANESGDDTGDDSGDDSGDDV